MKYTETFFKFPTKMYNLASIKNLRSSMDEEDEEEKLGLRKGTLKALDEPEKDIIEEAEWTPGFMRVHHLDILGWEDDYTVSRTYREVKKTGPDCTLVEIKTLGSYVCTWTRAEFERKLDEHVEKLREYLLQREAAKNAAKKSEAPY